MCSIINNVTKRFNYSIFCFSGCHGWRLYTGCNVYDDCQAEPQ